MTKAEQFTAAAAAVVAEYAKEAAGAVALFRKYRDAQEQKQKAMEQAKEAFSSLNNEYYSKFTYKDIKNPEKAAERAPLEKAKDEASELYTQAEESWKSAALRANMAANPIVKLQAVYILKLYQAFFRIYPNYGALPRNSKRLDPVKKFVKEIAAPGYYDTPTLFSATADARYYDYTGQTSAAIVEASTKSAEKALAECIRTESDILNRAELIEAATKQLKQFKATYEKSAKALYDLMNDVYTQSTMYNTFHSIHF